MAAAAVLAMLAFLPDQALGESCLTRVQQLGQRHGIATDPPTIPPGKAPKPVTSDDLARSGGVVEPPVTSDRSVITPPRDHSGMPTLPDVAPAAPKNQNPGVAENQDAADMVTAQALLVAARAQAERGMEAECLEALRKALSLLKRNRADAPPR